MDFFDAKFSVGTREVIEKMTVEQVADTYQILRTFVSQESAPIGLNFVFDGQRHQRIDREQGLTLYRQMGQFLQQRYQGSESRGMLHEVRL